MKKIILAALAVIMAAASVLYAQEAVKVTAAGKYEFAKDGMEIKVITPKIHGLADTKLMSELNRGFAKDAKEIIAEFNTEAAELKKDNPGADIHLGVYSNYIVKTDTKKYLAFSVYVVNSVGSSSEDSDFYTVDKRTRRLVTLKDLFKKNSNYVQVLSKYIKSEMERRNKKEGGMFWVKPTEEDAFKKIDKDQNFYIDSKERLVICFDKYEVAAGAQGSPKFIIPAKVMKKISAR